MAITKEQILGATDRKIRTISVPEWGGDVNVRVLPGPELDQLQGVLLALKVADGQNPARASAEILCRALVDDDGKQLFSPAEVGALHGKNPAVLQRVAAEAMEWNGLTEKAAEAAKGN